MYANIPTIQMTKLMWSTYIDNYKYIQYCITRTYFMYALYVGLHVAV